MHSDMAGAGVRTDCVVGVGVLTDCVAGAGDASMMLYAV